MCENDTLWLDPGKKSKNDDVCSTVFDRRARTTEQKWAENAINVHTCSQSAGSKVNKDRRFSIFSGIWIGSK